MIRIFFIVISLLFTSMHLAGQERAKFVGFETGFNFIGCDPVNKSYIRDDLPSYNADGYIVHALRNNMYHFFAGAKIELQTKNNKFRFSTGLRFTQLTSIIRDNTDPTYFYFLYKQDGTNTDYLRVDELKQTSSYFGVPVEARFFPFRPRLFRIYFTAGSEMGFNVATKNHITFHDQTMNSYRDEVSEIIGKPTGFYSTIYGGAGVMLSKDGLPLVSVGVNLVPFVNEGSSSLVSVVGGGGVRLQVQIPF